MNVIVSIICTAFILAFAFYTSKGMDSGPSKSIKIYSSLLAAVYLALALFTSWWLSGLIIFSAYAAIFFWSLL